MIFIKIYCIVLVIGKRNLADVRVTSEPRFYREQGGEADGRSIDIPNRRINDFSNHKYCLAMYNIHTMGK